MRKILVILVTLMVCSCSSVTVRTDGAVKDSRTPTFERSYTYWWWGLKGEHSINVREICIGKPVEQMQTTYTISDFFGGLFTLGIYAPRTTRIWCGVANQ